MSEIELLNIIKEKDDYIATLINENVELKTALSELQNKVLDLYDSYVSQINLS